MLLIIQFTQIIKIKKSKLKKAYYNKKRVIIKAKKIK